MKSIVMPDYTRWNSAILWPYGSPEYVHYPTPIHSVSEKILVTVCLASTEMVLGT